MSVEPSSKRDSGASQASLLSKVAVLMSGSVLSQLIPFAVLPILSRLYSPEDFGDLAVFLLATALLSTLGTCRFELALMLPKSRFRAQSLFQIGTHLCLLVGLITFLILSINPFGMIGLRYQKWAIVLPLSVVATGFCELTSYILNRHEFYRSLSINLVLMQIATATGKILSNPVSNIGLILGHCFGRVVWGLLLFLKTPNAVKLVLGQRRISYQLELIRRYRAFPQFNVPHALLTAFSGGFLVVFLSYFGQVESAGHVGFCRTLLFGPIGILSASLGRVFFKEASVSLGSKRFAQTTLSIFSWLAAASTPVFVSASFFAPEVFPVLFGAEWLESGLVATMLAVVSFLLLFTSWPERVFEVAGKQKPLFLIQVTFDALSMVTVWVILSQGGSALQAVLAYTIWAVVYHLVYLYLVFSYSSLAVREYLRLLVFIVLATCFTLTYLVGINYLVPELAFRLIFAGIFILLTIFLGFKLRRFLSPADA